MKLGIALALRFHWEFLAFERYGWAVVEGVVLDMIRMLE
jgi:hypothetical protein